MENEIPMPRHRSVITEGEEVVFEKRSSEISDSNFQMKQASLEIYKINEQMNLQEQEDILTKIMEDCLPHFESPSHVERQKAYQILDVVEQKLTKLDLSKEIRFTGTFYKQGGGIKTWKERFFAISEQSLLYFKDKKQFEEGYHPKKGWITQGCIHFADVVKITTCGTAICLDANVKESNRPKKGTQCIHVHTAKRNYPILGFSEPDVEQWLKLLNEALKRFQLKKLTAEWLDLHSTLKETRAFENLRFHSNEYLLENIELISDKDADIVLQKLLTKYEEIGSLKKYVLKDLFLLAVEDAGRWLNAMEFFKMMLNEEKYHNKDAEQALEDLISKRLTKIRRETNADHLALASASAFSLIRFSRLPFHLRLAFSYLNFLKALNDFISAVIFCTFYLSFFYGLSTTCLLRFCFSASADFSFSAVESAISPFLYLPSFLGNKISLLLYCSSLYTFNYYCSSDLS